MTSLGKLAFPSDDMDGARIHMLVSTRRRSLSTSSTVSTDSETASPLPTSRQVPSSLATCPVRAPCLKRNTSAPQSSVYAIQAISTIGQQLHAVTEAEDSDDVVKQLDASKAAHFNSATPSLATPLCSFAPPRSFCAAPPARTVRFCDSPPERGLTHSGKHYDRRPIKCTQGGSANDLSLHRTPTVGRGDDDDGANDEEEGVPMSQRSAGKTRWSGLKNGCVIGSALGVDSASASQIARGDSDPNICKLPSHNVQSFGRLSTLGSAVGAKNHTGESAIDSSFHDLDDVEDDAEETSTDDAEDSATPTVRFSEVLAALKNSPDATPRQSPAVRIRWETCESYFSMPGDSVSGSEDETPQTLTAVVDLKNIDEETTPTTTSPTTLAPIAIVQQSEASREASPRASPLASPNGEREEAAAPVSLRPRREMSTVRKPSLSPNATACRSQPPAGPVSTASLAASLNSLGLASPTDASEGSTISSSSSLSGSHGCFTMDSSPMSSRCSSVDAWSGISSDEMESTHLDSPTGCGWGSSSCTSPDLCPVEVAKALSAHAKPAPGEDHSMTPQQRLMRRPGNRSSSPSPAASPCGGAERSAASASDASRVNSNPDSLNADKMHLGLHSTSIRSRRAASRLSSEASSSISAETSPIILPSVCASPLDSAPASPALECRLEAPLDDRISPAKKERSTSRESGGGSGASARRKSSGAGGAPGTKTKKSGGRVSNGSAFSGDCSFGGDEGCLGGF